MNSEIEIREGLPTDKAALEILYPAAFLDEDLLGLVNALLSEKNGVLSLVAINDEGVVGHILFTVCGIAGCHEKAALLGPVAVTPEFQRRGIGGALIQEGLSRLQNEGVKQVYVLGDPAYYSRFGFKAQNKVQPPYPLPQEWAGAWQCLCLFDDEKPGLEGGMLCVPGPWRQPSLWAL